MQHSAGGLVGMVSAGSVVIMSITFSVGSVSSEDRVESTSRIGSIGSTGSACSAFSTCGVEMWLIMVV